MCAQQLLYSTSSSLPSLLAPSLSPLNLPSGRYLCVIPGMLEITIISLLIQGLAPLTGTALTPQSDESLSKRAKLKRREQREKQDWRVGGESYFNNQTIYLMTQNMGWRKAILFFQLLPWRQKEVGGSRLFQLKPFNSFIGKSLHKILICQELKYH